MQIHGNKTTTIWRKRLSSSLQIAVACAIVGCTTLYGPTQIQHQIAYPSFSYLTVVLIVSEATLGETLLRTWHALIATALAAGPSVLCLWLIGPAHLTSAMSALAVGVASFGVAVLEPVPLLSKRLAFCQIIIIFAGAATQGAGIPIVMHALQVTASTALGVLASILASVFPIPHIAAYKVMKDYRLYAENVSERLKHLAETVAGEDISAASELSSKAQALKKSASRILERMEQNEAGLSWEGLLIRSFMLPHLKHQMETINAIERALVGMEMALASQTRSRNRLTNQLVRDELRMMTEDIKCSLSFTLPPEEPETRLAPKRKIIPLSVSPTHLNMPLFFFFFCVHYLNDGLKVIKSEGGSDFEETSSCKEKNCILKRIIRSLKPGMSYEGVKSAVRCSLSLGLAMFVGSIYNKQSAKWSGLAIAVTLVTKRHATIMVAHARAQGTALGSVYGVLCSFFFHHSTVLRLTCLLPWIIFAVFLRHNKMYRAAGSDSAIMGAILLLGRKYFGNSDEFAIERLAEAFIGLCCFIAVETLLQPKRAASLAKDQLSKSFAALTECVAGLTIQISPKKSDADSSFISKKQRKLKSEITQLKRFIAEAEVEPDLWFTPFPGNCYSKMFESIKRLENLSIFMASASQLQHIKTSADWGVHGKKIKADMQILEEMMCCLLLHIKQIATSKSLPVTKEKLAQGRPQGKPPNDRSINIANINDHETEKILSSFMQHVRDINKDIHAPTSSQQQKIILNLCSLGFCMRSSMAEMRRLEEKMMQGPQSLLTP